METYLVDIFLKLAEICIPDISERVLVLVTLVIVFLYFNRDRTAMGKHPNSIEKELPNISHKQELEGIVSSLSDGLRSIDIQTNWSFQYFTPLDAEVEIIKGIHRKRKIMDLLSAIKKSKDRLFLVLGDPGSGKSVSLRKLCQDLSKETKKTKKIPIYINLKEWQIDKKWDHDNPPSTEDLMEFVLSNLRKRDIFISRFFDRKIDDQTYFERLYFTGHLFFLFDSFDEIPSVLNEDENSWLIKELSKVISTFLKGVQKNSSQGILASRLFRKPTQEFQCTTILEIRPFSEKKIIKTFERNGKIDNTIIKNFFKNHSHLIPIARNPFTATLISEYIDFNNGALPKTHAELYENYINQLLDNCKDQMKKKCISKEQIISFAKTIANLMHKSNQGWEIETQILRDNPDADKYIDILKFARMGRGNTGDERIFSFVHRRFAEYFMAKNMLDNNEIIDLQSIPKDSQLRDALVLYCEIANDETATQIADFCWEIIKTTNNLQNIEVIHALRFLRDAFKGRKECLINFNAQLAGYMEQQIKNDNNDMLSIKIIVECVSLLDDNSINKNILLALQLNNYWITETTFHSCRNISNLSKDIMSKFEDFFIKMPTINLLQSYSDYKFALSLSESFSKLQFWVHVKIFDFLFLTVSLILFPIFIFKSPHFAIFTMYIIMIYTNQIVEVLGYVITHKISKVDIVNRMVYSLVFFCTMLFIIKDITSLFVWLIPFLCSIAYPVSIISKKLSMKTIRKFIVRPEICKSIIVTSILVSVMAVIVYAINNFVFLKYICFTIFGILIIGHIIVSFILDLYNYYSQNKLLKKIDFQSCNNREIIYKQFVSFKNNKVKLKYVNLLELHVHNVSGEWPDRDIFRRTSNPANIRLTQLEEKWLGINR